MKKFLLKLMLAILIIIIFVATAVMLGEIIELTIVPSDYLFYEHSPLASALLAPLMIIPALFLAELSVNKVSNKLFKEQSGFLHIITFKKKLGLWWIGVIALWLIAFYMCMSSLTYVTESKIVKLSPIDLKGKSYAYSEVEKIEAGFGNKAFSIYDYKTKGSFYYKIIVDGSEVVFHTPSANLDIERYEDSYLELEEFDKALCELGIEKSASAKGYEKCYFDQVYVDRFLRIIELK